jgi:hypothetical protein
MQWCAASALKDRGRMALQNIGILPHHYTAAQPKRPCLEPIFKWIQNINNF